MATAKHTVRRAKFTRGRVDGFTCPAGQSEAFLWDAATPGLGLRVRAGGARQYIFQSRLHRRTLRLTLGSSDAWDIESARNEARRLRIMVDSGIDPRDEQRKQEQVAEADRRERQRAVVTVGTVWPVYVEDRRDDWSQAHIADHVKAMQEPGQPRKRSKELTAAGVLYTLRDVRLADLTADCLAEWLAQEKKTRPTVTARGYRLLRACLTWCSEHTDYQGLVDPAVIRTGKVRRAVPSTGIKDDVLQREQLRLWFDGVRRIGNPVVSAYLQALLLTGSRRNEMAGVRWNDVDFQWCSLTLGDKIEEQRTIPLTPYLAQLLAALPRRNEWVFNSPTSNSGRLMDVHRAHVRALQVVGLPHVSVHGLRRSFATLAEWVECPVGIVAQIQGHKPSATVEKHYRRRPLDLLRLWHTKIEDWMLGQAGIEQPVGQGERGLRLIQV